MQSVAVSQLRAHLVTYLDKVSQGEEIIVTSRGREVARILPPGDRMTRAREQLNALRQHAKVDDVISSIDVNWVA